MKSLSNKYKLVLYFLDFKLMWKLQRILTLLPTWRERRILKKKHKLTNILVLSGLQQLNNK